MNEMMNLLQKIMRPILAFVLEVRDSNEVFIDNLCMSRKNKPKLLLMESQ